MKYTRGRVLNVCVIYGGEGSQASQDSLDRSNKCLITGLPWGQFCKAKQSLITPHSTTLNTKPQKLTQGCSISAMWLKTCMIYIARHNYLLLPTHYNTTHLLHLRVVESGADHDSRPAGTRRKHGPHCRRPHYFTLGGGGGRRTYCSRVHIYTVLYLQVQNLLA